MNINLHPEGMHKLNLVNLPSASNSICIRKSRRSRIKKKKNNAKKMFENEKSKMLETVPKDNLISEESGYKLLKENIDEEKRQYIYERLGETVPKWTGTLAQHE